MATPEQCKFYNKCGFVAFRKECPDKHCPALPKDGDCGKMVETCGRINPIVPIPVESYGPMTREEIEIVYPELPDNNSTKKHRLVGGAFK